MEEKSTAQAYTELLGVLKVRFNANMSRHKNLDWPPIQIRLEANPLKLWSLDRMEQTGGEPDVIGYIKESAEYIFCDCSTESPIGRRNLCYDQKALVFRKRNKPQDSVLGVAEAMGVELLTEDHYRDLQKLGEFDTKTSSWIVTPDEVRELGGALFCDRRYNQVFTYHNGAESYYASRGFRGLLKV